jgi:hypothetical protein
MGLVDDVVDHRCKMARIIEDEFTSDEFGVLDKWLERGYGPVRLARGFRQGGYDVAQATLTKHLDGACCCDPDGGHPYRGINAS